MVSDAGVLTTVQCWLVEPFCIHSTRSPGLSLVAAIGHHASMENFHPLCRMPSHADALKSAHCCAEFAQGCDELSAQEIVPNVLYMH